MDKDDKYLTPEEAAQTLPGAAKDIADDEKASEKEVKEDVRTLNNNPRNNDNNMP